MESPPTKAKQREGSLGTLLAPCRINRGLYSFLCKWHPSTAKRWPETMHFVAAFSTPCKPFFGDVVKTLLGLNNLTRGAPSVNQRAAGSGSQRGSSSACFSNGYVLEWFSSLKSIQKVSLGVADITSLKFWPLVEWVGWLSTFYCKYFLSEENMNWAMKHQQHKW